jgi:hypothetical protein
MHFCCFIFVYLLMIMSMLTIEQFIKILNEKLEEKFEQKITPLSQTIVDLKSKVEDVVEHIT